MGFKLGKAQNTLTEFEVINQEITDNQDKIIARSVNKLRQDYAFPAKANIIMEMDFIKDSTFRALSKIVRNRNQLKEGFLLTPLPYQDDSEFNFIGVGEGTGPHSLFFLESDPKVLPTLLAIQGGTEFETANIPPGTPNYNDIDSFDSNGVTLTVAGPTEQRNRLLATFDISAFGTAHSLQEISRLGLLLFGMKTHRVRIFIHNFTRAGTADEWYLIRQFRHSDSSDFSNASFFDNKQLMANASLPWADDSLDDDYISSNKIHFMIEGDSVKLGRTSLYIQHLKAFVNSYNVVYDGNLGFNFRDPNGFTGTGRRASLDFSEI